MLVLFTDTDCDVTPKMADELGYKLIIMPYSIDGKEIYPYIDEEFDDKKFYSTLRKGIIPNTGALNPYDYDKYFRPYFEKGDDILYVHFSVKMSGTFASMQIAVNQLKEEFPNSNFYEIDTRAITICSLSIILEISKLYKNGKTAQEILDWANDNVDKYSVYFFAEDLKFFKHSGRVSGLAAFFGSIAGVRPLMFMDNDGIMKTVGKEYGRNRALKRILKYVVEVGEDVGKYKIIIGHCDLYSAAIEIEDLLKKTYGEDIDTMIIPINPTIGSHCGPSTLGVSFHAKHR